ALGYRQPVARGILGRAARTRRPVLVNDVTADPDYIPIPNTQHRAELAIPIQVAERLLGVLNIEDERPFTDEDATAFQIVADQLAVAIDNARLFDDTRANVNDLMALYELSQRITGARSADDTMRAALEELAANGVYRCTIALFSDYDQTGRPLRFHVPYIFVPGEGVFPVDEYVPTGDDELNPLLDRGEMVAIADVMTDERVPESLRTEQLAVGRPALAIIPLMEGGQRIGNLVLSHSSAHHWTEAELRRYRSSANQIAVAIENARRFEREAKRTNRLELIARLRQRIAARLDSTELLNTTAEALHMRLGYEHISIFLVEAADETVLVQSAVASQWDWLGNPPYRQPMEQGILGVAAQTRAPVLINDVQADERYVPIPGADALRAELAIPILLGERLLGVLDAASVQRLSEDDVTGLSIVADQLAIALENARLYNRVQAVAVLDERQRLARDLHDSVTQLIFSITLVAQSIRPAYQKDAMEGERRIARVLELSQQALAEMRELLTELRNPVQEGLVPAIRKHIERLYQREGVPVQYEVQAYTPRPVEQEETLYRIVQEALNNVVKHARAQTVRVQLAQDARGLELTVSDDGLGFDAEHLPSNGGSSRGLGLRGMRERIERLGGTIYIQSNPGAGTAIVAFLPERREKSL
ncbi:MAG: GAF domain-containing protein, partial [Anaerolineales bacterium]|nr:GAF domain-containing protein [Anaerolineales bacterium]